MKRDRSEERWIPRTDVYATQNSYVFEMDLPGVEREEVDVELEENNLTISGERTREVRDEEEEEGRAFHRIERETGSFQRSYMLADGIDAEAVAASFENGTLRVTVPLPETAETDQRRRIEVK